MTKLQHTHESGGECLACSMAYLRMGADSLPCAATVSVYGFHDALDRIEAALLRRLRSANSARIAFADQSHLEYGARFLAGMLKRAEAAGLLVPEAAAWLEAERARKGQT